MRGYLLPTVLATPQAWALPMCEGVSSLELFCSLSSLFTESRKAVSDEYPLSSVFSHAQFVLKRVEIIRRVDGARLLIRACSPQTAVKAHFEREVARLVVFVEGNDFSGCHGFSPPDLLSSV